jgi:hypothetical protein
LNDQAAGAQHTRLRLLDWRPSLSDRQLARMVREQQPVEATLREVEAIEYLDDGDEPTLSQLGGLEQHDGAMWMVCGIYEPLDPHAPWAIALIARRGVGPVLRTPSVLVAQEAVTRVYDGIRD